MSASSTRAAISLFHRPIATRSFAALAFVFGLSCAKASAGDCDNLLRQGVFAQSLQNQSWSSAAQAMQGFCGQYQHSLSSGGGFNVSVPGTPVGVGASASSSEAIASATCTNAASNSDSKSARSALTTKADPKLLDAYDQCVALDGSGISTTINYLNDIEGVAIAIKNTPSGSTADTTVSSVAVLSSDASYQNEVEKSCRGSLQVSSAPQKLAANTTYSIECLRPILSSPPYYDIAGKPYLARPFTVSVTMAGKLLNVPMPGIPYIADAPVSASTYAVQLTQADKLVTENNALVCFQETESDAVAIGSLLSRGHPDENILVLNARNETIGGHKGIVVGVVLSRKIDATTVINVALFQPGAKWMNTASGNGKFPDCAASKFNVAGLPGGYSAAASPR